MTTTEATTDKGNVDCNGQSDRDKEDDDNDDEVTRAKTSTNTKATRGGGLDESEDEYGDVKR